ncbi:hypothetical protein THMIRHAT_21630 [Thiosulfativibrio zosterae]|uniref:Uncharacterized protein n=1 Tax=Thiosulfativibrio zosterae TaxID=2675053 RepID=A0A6F8PQW0_9GAMM|nr:hypothetical protein THMIRHAT_21630 [Thiosulfativibrio zosterae]
MIDASVKKAVCNTKLRVMSGFQALLKRALFYASSGFKNEYLMALIFKTKSLIDKA